MAFCLSALLQQDPSTIDLVIIGILFFVLGTANEFFAYSWLDGFTFISQRLIPRTIHLIGFVAILVSFILTLLPAAAWPSVYCLLIPCAALFRSVFDRLPKEADHEPPSGIPFVGTSKLVDITLLVSAVAAVLIGYVGDCFTFEPAMLLMFFLMLMGSALFAARAGSALSFGDIHRIVLPILLAALYSLALPFTEAATVLCPIAFGTYWIESNVGLAWLVSMAKNFRIDIPKYVSIRRLFPTIGLIAGIALASTFSILQETGVATIDQNIIVALLALALLLTVVALPFSRGTPMKQGILLHPDEIASEAQRKAEADSLNARCELLAKDNDLTPKEAEVLINLAKGFSTDAIAGALVVSPNTVKTHIRGIYSKLNVHSKQELLDLLYESTVER